MRRWKPGLGRAPGLRSRGTPAARTLLTTKVTKATKKRPAVILCTFVLFVVQIPAIVCCAATSQQTSAAIKGLGKWAMRIKTLTAWIGGHRRNLRILVAAVHPLKR